MNPITITCADITITIYPPEPGKDKWGLTYRSLFSQIGTEHDTLADAMAKANWYLAI